MDLSKYDVKGVLDRLGIKEINYGATTGTRWIETSGTITRSTSPIDGNTWLKWRRGTR